MLADLEQASGQEVSPRGYQPQQSQSLASENDSIEQTPSVAGPLSEGQLESGEFVPFGLDDQEVDCGWPMTCGDEATDISGRRGRRDSSLMCETLDQNQNDLERENSNDLNQYFSPVEGSIYDFHHQPVQQFGSNQDCLALSQQQQQQQPQQPPHQHQQQQQHQQQHMPLMSHQMNELELNQHQQYQWRHENFQQQIDYQQSQNHIDDYQHHHYPSIKCRDGQLEETHKAGDYYHYQASTSSATTTTMDINNSSTTTTAFATSSSQQIRDHNNNDNQYLTTSTTRCYPPAGVTKFDSGRQLIEYRPQETEYQHMGTFHEHPQQAYSQIPSYTGSAQLQTQLTETNVYHHDQQRREQMLCNQPAGYLEPMEEESSGKTYHLLGQQPSNVIDESEISIGGNVGASEPQSAVSSIPHVSKLYDPTQELSKCLLESGADLFGQRGDEHEEEEEEELEEDEDEELWSQVSAEASSTASSHDGSWATSYEGRKAALSGRSSAQSFAGRSGVCSRASRASTHPAVVGERRPGCRPETLHKLRLLLESRRVIRSDFPRPSGSKPQQVLAKSVVAQVVESPTKPPPVVTKTEATRTPAASPTSCSTTAAQTTSTGAGAQSPSEGRQLRNRSTGTSMPGATPDISIVRGYGIETRASKRRRNNDKTNHNNHASASCSPASSLSSSQSSLFGATCRLESTTRATSRQSFSGSDSLVTNTRKCRLTRSNSSESRAASDLPVAGRRSAAGLESNLLDGK